MYGGEQRHGDGEAQEQAAVKSGSTLRTAARCGAAPLDRRSSARARTRAATRRARARGGRPSSRPFATDRDLPKPQRQRPRRRPPRSRRRASRCSWHVEPAPARQVLTARPSGEDGVHTKAPTTRIVPDHQGVREIEGGQRQIAMKSGTAPPRKRSARFPAAPPRTRPSTPTAVSPRTWDPWAATAPATPRAATKLRERATPASERGCRED